jgi:hypothetical protein
MIPEPAPDFDEQFRIDAIVEDRVAKRLAIATWTWRFCLLIIETGVIAVGVLVAQTIHGTPLLDAIYNVTLIAFAFLLGGFAPLTISDFVNTNLAWLTRWWRLR